MVANGMKAERSDLGRFAEIRHDVAKLTPMKQGPVK